MQFLVQIFLQKTNSPKASRQCRARSCMLCVLVISFCYENAYNFTHGSKHKVYWLCRFGHSHYTTINSKTWRSKSSTQGCKVCGVRKVKRYGATRDKRQLSMFWFTIYLRAFIRSISIWRLASSSASLRNLCLFELPKIPSISTVSYTHLTLPTILRV